MYSENSKTEQQCLELFHRLFEDREKLLNKLASEGWEKSDLFFVHHPTAQQRYEEALNFHNNIKNFFRRNDKKSADDPPKREDFLEQEIDINNINPMEELIKIWGLCLWDVFSNNHEVVGADRKVYDIGSFRGAGGFIADYINDCLMETETKYDYLDFYMGTIWASNRADLTPVYELIFSKLKVLNCDWIYHFPRLYLVDLGDMKEDSEAERENDFLNYDPSESVAKQLEKEKRTEEASRLKEDLDRIYEESVEEAKYQPLPEIVLAYKNIYGHLPGGWPHRGM
jgi:hypothetical protein